MKKIILTSLIAIGSFCAIAHADPIPSYCLQLDKNVGGERASDNCARVADDLHARIKAGRKNGTLSQEQAIAEFDKEQMMRQLSNYYLISK